MKLKYFSGDFAALYNRALEDYEQQQDELNQKFDGLIDRLLEKEVNRLEQSLVKPFSKGDMVETSDGRVGKVISCNVEVRMRHDQSDMLLGPLEGPTRYFQLQKDSDEEVITCEGMLHKVVVQFEASEIEKEWGKEKVTSSFYPDELSYIKRV